MHIFLKLISEADRVARYKFNIEMKLESILLGGISITSDMQMTPSLWQKVKNYIAS